jgi:glycosyltransferase involved in cell wall biosynthesis
MSLPSKLTSYFSAGRPVLAASQSDGATAAELKRSGGAGLLVRPGDPQILSAAIARLREDKAWRAAMGGAGLVYAHTRLDRETTMLILDELVVQVLRGANSGCQTA